MGILEIKHIRAHNNSLAMSCRLQNIVTAMRNQTTSYENNIANAIYLSQLSNGIEQNHIMSLSWLFLQLGSSGRSKAPLLAHILNSACTQHSSRSNYQARLRMSLADFSKGGQYLLLLPLMGGASQKNTIIVLQPQFLNQQMLFLRADIGIGLIKFGITSNSNQILASP